MVFDIKTSVKDPRIILILFFLISILELYEKLKIKKCLQKQKKCDILPSLTLVRKHKGLTH